jgi:hypothetical protein
MMNIVNVPLRGSMIVPWRKSSNGVNEPFESIRISAHTIPTIAAPSTSNLEEKAASPTADT